MSVRPIRYLGDPVLRRRASEVPHVDDSIRQLVDDMIESMYAADGVGLAAPQIGIGLRIVVLGMPDEEPVSIINPVIVERTGARELEGEGCLSVPGYRGSVTRSQQVTVEGLDADGRALRITACDNLLAQAIEHEVDHINGMLYVDRLTSIDTLTKLEGDNWGAAASNGEDGDEGD
ncbi:MAG: peptide deformylase [Chloroflexi bacterium]|nr:peptide deformylase [Chloroflexota bacterium]